MERSGINVVVETQDKFQHNIELRFAFRKVEKMRSSFEGEHSNHTSALDKMQRNNGGMNTIFSNITQ